MTSHLPQKEEEILTGIGAGVNIFGKGVESESKNLDSDHF